jgi:hypothetical protein
VDVAAGKLAKLSWSSDTTSALTDGTDGTYAEVGRVGTNWIQIDLGASYSIDNIQIQPRSLWNVRLTGTHVYMSDTDLSGLSSDQLANATLVAAAPEMLEVLIDVVKALEDTLETQRCSVVYLRTLNSARALIQKARGEK